MVLIQNVIGVSIDMQLTLCKEKWILIQTVKTQMKCSILFVKVKEIFRQKIQYLFFCPPLF